MSVCVSVSTLKHYGEGVTMDWQTAIFGSVIAICVAVTFWAENRRK